MDVDNPPFPSSLIWVSKRLTSHIVDLDDAKRRSGMRFAEVKARTPGLTPGVPFVEATAQLFDPTSTEDYAVRATKIVRPDTGSLKMPNKYIRMILDFHLATFDVPFVWQEGTIQRVATLFADQYVPGIGRVFVALFGSPHSILADRAEEAYTGRTPSDADGLYRILHSTREPRDVPLRPQILDDPRQVAYSDRERADLAAQIIYGLSDPLPARPLDVLATADVIIEKHKLRHARQPSNSIQHDLIIIGAALWAGTPSRRVDPLAVPGVSPDRVHLWPRFDIGLFEYLEDRRSRRRPNIPQEALSSETWPAFASWFVDLGRHLGEPTAEMNALRKPGRLNLKRYLSHGWRDSYSTKPTGRTGFVLRLDERQLVLVTESGETFSVHDSGCIYWPSGSPRWLEPREKPVVVPNDLMERVRLAVWGQAAEWRRRLPR
jgi:hypothetical protein